MIDLFIKSPRSHERTLVSYCPMRAVIIFHYREMTRKNPLVLVLILDSNVYFDR